MLRLNTRFRIPTAGNLAIVTAVLLIIALGLTRGLPHWNKLRLLRMVEESRGSVRSVYVGPERWRERVGEGDRNFFTRLTRIQADDVDDVFLSLASAQPELQFLSVSGQEISGEGLDPLGGAQSVREISLINAGLNDMEIRPLGGLDGLEKLRLPHNALEGLGFRQFSDRSALRHLDLTYCPVSDQGLRFIARLPNLQSLDLSATAITSRGLIHLELHPELTTLNLYGTSVGDDAIWSLARIPKLDSVVLMDTRVSHSGRELLQQLKPGCRIDNQPNGTRIRVL